jgi:hypothetical protein
MKRIVAFVMAGGEAVRSRPASVPLMPASPTSAAALR